MHIFPVSYFPPVPWFAAAQNHSKIILEVHQHFRKQQYTNRSQIKLSNRIMSLTVPIQRRGEKAAIKDKKISYAENWQKQHWYSLESAYRGSPYFEFYQDKLAHIFEQKFIWLLDLNLATTQLCLEILGLNIELQHSEEYHDSSHYTTDYRSRFDPSLRKLPSWFQPVPYPQVFEGFSAGLSVIDLICNMGPESRLILQQSFISDSNKG